MTELEEKTKETYKIVKLERDRLVPYTGEETKDFIKRLKKEGKVIPASNDLVIKALFTAIEAREYLVEIIHHVTKLPFNELIECLTLINNEFFKESMMEKHLIADLMYNYKKAIINIEAQNATSKNSDEKNAKYFYKSALLATEVHQIILNFDKVYGDDVVTEFTCKSEDGKYEKESSKKIYEISLPNVVEKYYNKEKLSDFERRLLMLTVTSRKELYKIAGKEKDMIKMADKLVELSEYEGLVEPYNFIEWEREVTKSACEEEMEREIAKATEKAENAEKNAKLETAKNLLNMNMSMENISKVTGLSIKEIENIK